MAKSITLQAGPVIPYEVIERIIKLFHPDKDIDTLLSLSLLDHYFHWAARKRIFSKIHLETDRSTLGKVEFFRELLDRTPSLAHSVHKFLYVNDLQNEHAPAIFERLRNVKSFTWGFKDYEIYGARQVKWNPDISPALRRSIFSFIPTNDITSMKIYNIHDIPGTILHLLPRLEQLDLHAVTFSNGDSACNSALDLPSKVVSGKACTEPIRLKGLALRMKMLSGFMHLMDAEQQNGEPLFNFSQVERAWFRIDDPDMVPLFLQFLRETETLTDLTFKGYSGDWDFNMRDKFASSLNPRSYGTLCRIKLWHIFDGRQYDPFAGLAYELSELVSTAGGDIVIPLQEIVVKIEIESDGLCDTSPEVWSRLDSVLSGPGNFPYLQSVNINITVHYDQRPLSETLIRGLNAVEQKCFSGLRALQRKRGLAFHFQLITNTAWMY